MSVFYKCCLIYTKGFRTAGKYEKKGDDEKSRRDALYSFFRLYRFQAKLKEN